MSVYHRTQILLEPEQHAALTEIAADEKRSVSEIFREITATYLAEKDKECRREKALATLERMTTFRKELAARATQPFPDPVDIIDEAYDEQMQNWERIWRGEE